MTRTQRGALIAGGLVIGALSWSFILYKAIEPADHEGLRQLFVLFVGWLAPIVIIGGIALTRWVSVREVKAHYSGMDKGLDKVAGMSERIAQTRTSMVTKIKQPDIVLSAPGKTQNDYLPVMHLRSGDPNKPIEM